jgi:hypothetical protein
LCGSFKPWRDADDVGDDGDNKTTNVDVTATSTSLVAATASG